jgi:ferredoxin
MERSDRLVISAAARRVRPRTVRTQASTTHRRLGRDTVCLYTVELILPEGNKHSLKVCADEHILEVAYRENIDLPSACLMGWCTTCAGRLVGEEWVDQSASRRYFPEDAEAGFVLLCTAEPRSDLYIRTHQREALRDHRMACGLPTPRGGTYSH